MAMLAAVVNKSPTLSKLLDELRTEYPRIDAVLDEFCEALRLDYVLPFQRASDDRKDVYVHRMDYPPLGSAGQGLFLVLFHSPPSTPGRGPYRTSTIIAILLRVRRTSRGRRPPSSPPSS
jgi:hypothetical protein